MTRVDGIVLAAGRSRRMGTPKAQLEVRPGTTFLEQAVHLLREGGCRFVVAVVNADEDWTARLADVAGATVVINERQDSQQIDSLRLGLAYLPDDSEGVIVLPVDFPGVRVETVARLLESFRERGAAITVPTCDGTPGHPVIFARAVFGELLADPLPAGAESVVEAHINDRAEVPVDDTAVLHDVDSVADLHRFSQ